MQIDEAVIDRSAEEGARCVALSLVAEADHAAQRLAGGGDDEALHDFRVALRRLRSTLRAFRPWLEGSVGRKMERRLRRLARATNDARDAEVALRWLSEQRAALSRRQRLAIEVLCERLEARRAEWEHEQASVLARYARTSRKLLERLQTYRRRIDSSARSSPFGGALARCAAEHLTALREDVASIRASGDEEHVHRARIEGKKLRYLLEPLRGNRHVDSQRVVKVLKRLQDVLGDLHDCHRMAAEVSTTLVDTAVERARELHAAAYERGASGARLRRELSAGPRAGLLALDRLLLARREALFATLEREWRAGGVGALAGEIEGLVSGLEARAGGRVENERTFLLSELPPRAAQVGAIDIAQGWLPGERLRERIRRVAEADGVRYWRGLEQGAGPQRLEAEEEISRELFEALWPLTEGRRVNERRRKFAEGHVTWEIDEFEGRDLVLAKAELPAQDVSIAVPEWLRPLVVREVTEDPSYSNHGLALSTPAAPTPRPEPNGRASDAGTGQPETAREATAPSAGP